jgi:hypothetical protein
MDAIDGGRLEDGNTVLVMDSNGIFRPYRCNATSGAAEASPTTIAPDTNAGNKRLILATLGALGLAFPATQVANADANTLDDYEKGTWTPGVSFGGGVTGITYTSQVGRYTKIGNLVAVSGYCLLSAKGSSTGQALVTGLPFTTHSTAGTNSGVAIRIVDISYANQIFASTAVNATTVTLTEATEAGGATNIDDTNFANTSMIILSVSYRVA